MDENEEKQEQRALLALEGIERIRRVMFEGQEYWSVVDVVGYLTEAANPSKYWNTLRGRLVSEGAKETLSQITELPMRSADGRLRKTAAMTRPTLLRLIQSIPSSKVEPLKLFLAAAGDEKIALIEQQANSVEQLRQHYRELGRDEEWIIARILYIVTRNAWTSEIQVRGVADSLSIAKLTSLLNQRTFGLTTAQHKNLKGLSQRHNLADHKNRMELILSALAEETATGLHQKNNSSGYDEIQQDVQEAGDTAAIARRAVEQQLGSPVVSPQNFLSQRRKGNKQILNKSSPSLDEPPQQSSLFDAPSENKETHP